jgi:lipopolysaccharide/colanic/teichoic acid biosynthesis glycosyltransferase
LKTDLESFKTVSVFKRIFDVSFASVFLLIFSPILAIIAIGIRLDSKGPIVYRSKRVGHGYQVFDFLKFRTMKMNADHLVKELMKENQYKNEEDPNASVQVKSNEYLIDAMGNTIDEETFIAHRNNEKAGAFFKVQNDPRITKIGSFLRATSLDELPQFFNVLFGDMSIVGNRPLPLYEAEQLTTDQWVGRFLAPAGITGLWQVEKRGKSNMSETERKELDNDYTKNQSFWYDMRILAKTFPALLQKENV